MRTSAIYVAITAAVAVACAAHGESLALYDPDGVFGGAAGPGSASMAFQNLFLAPGDSVCLHGYEDYADFVPVFIPEIPGVEILPSMLDGFTVNSNGTLRLALVSNEGSCGSVNIGAPPLKWGSLSASAWVHRCIGGVQDECFACGRRHPQESVYDCSHDACCAARGSYTNDCTCAMLFVRVNWDDDDWSWTEDRLGSSPCVGEDDMTYFRALGVGRMCCCYGDIAGSSSVAGLTASSGLRLWSGGSPAGPSAGAFSIEAVSASPTIGGSSVSYEVRDATNALLRSVTLHVTAANAEIRPDIDDDGGVDEFDRFSVYNDTTWQIRVRDEPYALVLASECPQDASASLEEVQVCGVAPAIRASASGGEALQPDVPTASSAFVSKNGTKTLYVDTSGGPGMASLVYSLDFGSVHPTLSDARIIKVVDLSVPERWETTNSLARLVYDYSDVYGYVEWTIWREGEPSPAAWGTGAEFSPGALPPGDYEVEVYFAEVFEGGCMGYTSLGALHVIDVRLASLFETANEANRIFNPTRKDDTTGNQDAETEVVYAGTSLEERYAAPRNFLYTVGDPVTGKFNISARFDATGADGCTNYYCAFYPRGGGPKIPGTETNVDFSASSVSFSLPAPSLATNVVWELRGGLDHNGNATLDSDESAPFAIYTNSANVVKYACLKGITKEQYNEFKQATDAEVYFQGDTPAVAILPHARTLLALFYANGSYANLNPDLQPDSSQVLSNGFCAFSNNADCFSEWLTHNNGLEFLPNGCAQIVQYEWEESSAMSQFMIYRTPFEMKRWMKVDGQNYLLRTNTSRNLEAFYNASIKDAAESYLSNAADGTEATFPLDGGWYGWTDFGSYNVFTNLSPAWVPGITIDVGVGPGYGDEIGVELGDGDRDNGIIKDFDAHATVGRGRMINPRYRFTVRKSVSLFGMLTTYKVASVEFTCVLTDLYDFNFEDGGRATKAAALQLGYGSGSVPGRMQNGKVFRHQMSIRHTYTNPF